jgi:hypothetical protein
LKRRKMMNQYVVTMTQKNGVRVKAVKVEAERKTDVMRIMEQKEPAWRVKNILKLYPEDFAE